MKIRDYFWLPLILIILSIAGCATQRAGSSKQVPVHGQSSPQTDVAITNMIEQVVDTLSRTLMLSSEPSGLRIYIGKLNEVKGTNFEEEDRYFKGITPMSIQVPPGQYIVALRTPESYDSDLLRVWKNTVPGGIMPTNTVGRASCADIPELFVGSESDCLLYFGDHGLAWVAKEYHVDIGTEEQQYFSVVFQER